MKTPEFRLSYKVLTPYFILVVILALILPRNGEFDYHYSRGSKWNYETLVAPFDFPVLKTEEQIAAEKEKLGASFVPCFKVDENILERLADDIFDMAPDTLWALNFQSGLASIYGSGVLPDEKELEYMSSEGKSVVVFIQRDKHAVKVSSDELHDIRSAGKALAQFMHSKYPGTNVDSVLTRSDMYSLIIPNLIYDRNTTESLHQHSSEYVSPTSGVFQAGNIIVSAGEIITADIEQILDSYKAEFRNTIGYNGSLSLMWLGNILMAFVLASLLLLLILFNRPVILERFNQFSFILVIYLMSSVLTFVSLKLPSNIVYMIPFPVFVMYMMAFFRRKLVMPVYALSLIPLMIYSTEGFQLYVMYLFAGFVAVFAFSYFNKGVRQFVTSLCIFAALLLVFITFKLMSGNISTIGYQEILFLFLGSLFCILAYPLIYLFEIIFNLVSVNRLVDLTETNQPLLRMLSEKAPGTFQHSLMVMNMADAAGRAIDCDVPLLRAAALYHDVGKILNPQCFVENQPAGIDYHAELTPKESAAEIINHVSDGVELAEKYGIPSVIREFIACHHGTTSTGYFITKYLNDGGDPADVSAFHYPGPIPKSKEQVILMLCDSLEAASRTLKDFSPQTVSDFVDRIYSEKYHAGQYQDADATLHEFEIVKQTLKSFIVQMHHGRIAYPVRKI